MLQKLLCHKYKTVYHDGLNCHHHWGRIYTGQWHEINKNKKWIEKEKKNNYYPRAILHGSIYKYIYKITFARTYILLPE